MFRVVPDQLRISEGWVRCGQCDEVFDANAHLRSLEEPAPFASPEEPRSAPDVPDPQTAATNVEQSLAGVAYGWEPVVEPQVEKIEQSVGIASTEAVQDTPKSEPEASRDMPPVGDSISAPEDGALRDAFLDQPTDLPVSAELQNAQYSSSLTDDWARQLLVVEEKEPAAGANSEDDVAPSFMPRTAQNSSTNKTWGRGVALTASVLLSLLLSAQFLYFERDHITANVPAMRPLLTYGCEVMGCSISAPRQIEAIAIESSAFTHVKSGIYNLSLSLRNAAAIDLAAPAIELTLTDMQDQTLVRRVLLPDDYNTKSLIGPHAELAVSVPIAVHADTALEKISGYKLVAFYP